MTLIAELKSPAKIGVIAILDIAVVAGFFAAMFQFNNMVSSYLVIPYNIFNFLVAVIMVAPSKWNPQKKIWQTLKFMFKKDKKVYHSIEVDERKFNYEK